MRKATLIVVLMTAILIGCNFSEYAQSEELAENIDDHRTGCEINADVLLTGYKQYDTNRLYFAGFGQTRSYAGARHRLGGRGQSVPRDGMGERMRDWA